MCYIGMKCKDIDIKGNIDLKCKEKLCSPQKLPF